MSTQRSPRRWPSVLGCATVLVLLLGTKAHTRDAGWTWNLPAGFPAPRIPPDNPMSIAKVELGRRLFYDENLSANRTQACASCHQQARAFSDGRRQAQV